MKPGKLAALKKMNGIFGGIVAKVGKEKMSKKAEAKEEHKEEAAESSKEEEKEDDEQIIRHKNRYNK